MYVDTIFCHRQIIRSLECKKRMFVGFVDSHQNPKVVWPCRLISKSESSVSLRSPVIDCKSSTSSTTAPTLVSPSDFIPENTSRTDKVDNLGFVELELDWSDFVDLLEGVCFSDDDLRDSLRRYTLWTNLSPSEMHLWTKAECTTSRKCCKLSSCISSRLCAFNPLSAVTKYIFHWLWFQIKDLQNSNVLDSSNFKSPHK